MRPRKAAKRRSSGVKKTIRAESLIPNLPSWISSFHPKFKTSSSSFIESDNEQFSLSLADIERKSNSRMSRRVDVFFQKERILGYFVPLQEPELAESVPVRRQAKRHIYKGIRRKRKRGNMSGKTEDKVETEDEKNDNTDKKDSSFNQDSDYDASCEIETKIRCSTRTRIRKSEEFASSLCSAKILSTRRSALFHSKNSISNLCSFSQPCAFLNAKCERCSLIRNFTASKSKNNQPVFKAKSLQTCLVI